MQTLAQRPLLCTCNSISYYKFLVTMHKSTCRAGHMCMSVCFFELGNWWTDYDGIRFGSFMVFESKNRRKKFNFFCLLLSLFFCSLSFSLVFILALLDCFFLHYDKFLLAFHSFFLLSQLFINVKYDYKFI
jgi:hypothetical protein